MLFYLTLREHSQISPPSIGPYIVSNSAFVYALLSDVSMRLSSSSFFFFCCCSPSSESTPTPSLYTVTPTAQAA